jgi:hypothetical protein
LGGLDASLTTLLCKKKNIVAKSKKVKTGYNLAETSKEVLLKKGLFYS